MYTTLCYNAVRTAGASTESMESYMKSSLRFMPRFFLMKTEFSCHTSHIFSSSRACQCICPKWLVSRTTLELQLRIQNDAFDEIFGARLKYFDHLTEGADDRILNRIDKPQ